MTKNYLQTFALLGGFGLLTACPPAPGTTTGTDTDTDTDTSSTTDDPPATTQTPTSEPPTSTSLDTTGTPTTTDTTDTTDTDTTTGGIDGALCVALGGTAGIGELVDAAIAGILVDDKINAYFLNSDVDGGNLASCLGKQLGALAECAGVTYDCQDMKAAHQGLGISTNDFADFAADFTAALDAHQATHPELTDADKDAILTALSGMSADIVEDASNDQSIYQRIGRKPAIRSLVGLPGEAGSFVDNVALNPAINGFFGATDFDRLNTCLTRQLSNIGGPAKYGLEVDAPAPADPGVGAGNPCKNMTDVHAGLTDANDNIGIDILDFGAIVADLVTAMNTAGVAQPDQDALLEIIGSMCEDIVMPEARNDCPTAQKLETIEMPGLGAAVPDEIYDGTLESMFCQDLVVPDDSINFVKDIEVTLGIAHGWVGDLTVKLVSPDNKLLTILSRAGLAEQGDNGGNCCGDSANLDPGFPLLFKNNAANDAEDLGKALPGKDQVICKDDGIDPCEWSPNPGSGPGMNFTDFLGDTAAGTWKLCVGDSNLNDAGTVDLIKLVIHRVKYDPMP